MKTLSVRDLSRASAEVWDGLKTDRDVVVVANGRPIAVLSSVTEASLDDTLAAIRRARAAVALSEIQRRSVLLGTDALTSGEIDAEIAAVRRTRRQPAKSSQ